MLILNGRETCSLCLGLDDADELKLAGLTEARGLDLVEAQAQFGVRLAVGFGMIARLNGEYAA